MKNKVFLGLGSNIAPRKGNIEAALRLIGKTPGVRLKNVSPLYETEPVGGPKQGPFLNGAAAIETHLLPKRLWDQLRTIEKKLKRRKRMKWGPRTIDLDILTYGNKVSTSSRLQLPHPRYHQRRFVLVPLADIAPRLVHPRLKATTAALLRQLTPQGQRVTMVARWKRSHFALSKRRRTKKSR